MRARARHRSRPDRHQAPRRQAPPLDRRSSRGPHRRGGRADLDPGQRTQHAQSHRRRSPLDGRPPSRTSHDLQRRLLIAQLLTVLQRRGVPIWTRTEVVDLIQEDGRVVGAVMQRDGRRLRVRAGEGVLIASGGFARNGDMRAKHSRDQPNDGQWTLANPGDSGELLQRAIERGAATDLMDEAWWVPALRKPDGTLAMVIQERARPGAIIVDPGGSRYFNEAGSSMEVGQHMYRRQRETGSGVPSWLIIDSRHRSRYLFAMMPPGFTPKKWLTSGAMKRAGTLAGLARDCGIDPDTLTATVERFNRFAVTGNDEDFGRGLSAHDRYMGDPTHASNPCLGPLTKPPFFAVQIFPGDVGTSGGLLCDEHSRVLDVHGDPIPGLYATGNATASVMGRAYPAGGASIGATCVFAYIAGEHAAAQKLR
ncbi:FAD-binding protein [Nonomuraea sp. NPDC046802]|uniref:FAD-binding protein n=1 Tax=Nonomuraea sp. NPDC046802 TaxID=3154919 RepID=UPI0033EFD718